MTPRCLQSHIRASRVFLGALAVLAVIFISASDIASAQDSPNGGLWYVFPEIVDVHTTPSVEAPRAPFTLRSGDKVAVERVVPGSELTPSFLQFARNGVSYYVPEPLLTRVVQWESRAPLLLRLLGIDASSLRTSLPIGEETVDRTTPLPIDYQPSDLVRLPQHYWGTEVPARLRKEAAEHCTAMLDAALKEGVNIKILSAYRSYAQQVYVYMRAVGSRGLFQRDTAKPGHSEHQLGTTIDLGGDDPRYWFKQEFAETPEGVWLQKNAHTFGFVQSLREDNQDRTGYISEPWHWRYLGTGEPQRTPRPGRGKLRGAEDAAHYTRAHLKTGMARRLKPRPANAGLRLASDAFLAGEEGLVSCRYAPIQVTPRALRKTEYLNL